jgi:hypothetical protein
MSPYRPLDRKRQTARIKAKHAECTRCGELKDECRCRVQDPMAVFTIDAPERAINVYLDEDRDDS